MYQLFAVTQPGLEPFLSQELAALGITAVKPRSYLPDGEVREEAGGLEFEASQADLYRVNLRLRTANRVLARLGGFGANGFEELRKKAARLDWQAYLKPGQDVSFRVTCHKSRLYHSDAVAREVLASINGVMPRPSRAVKYSEDGGQVPVLIVVRLLHDVCTISIDTSGASLHRRGYRLQTAKAPLRETLAAGLLYAAGWDQSSPLMDPFCGSGTIAIEAALMARNIAPGSNRRFAFFHWPGYDSPLWQKVYGEATSQERAECPPIIASDRDEGALAITAANAERAGVSGNLSLVHRAFSAIEPPQDKGWLISNPPYGVRVSADHDLRNLYTRLGEVLNTKFSGWNIHLLCGDAFLAGHTRLQFGEPLRLSNGGLPVGFYSAKVN